MVLQSYVIINSGLISELHRFLFDHNARRIVVDLTNLRIDRLKEINDSLVQSYPFHSNEPILKNVSFDYLTTSYAYDVSILKDRIVHNYKFQFAANFDSVNDNAPPIAFTVIMGFDKTILFNRFPVSDDPLLTAIRKQVLDYVLQLDRSQFYP
jgi:hypothetical protein